MTEAGADPETSMDELLVKSQLTLGALEKYLKPDEKLEDRFDRRKLKRMLKEGLIE